MSLVISTVVQQRQLQLRLSKRPLQQIVEVGALLLQLLVVLVVALHLLDSGRLLVKVDLVKGPPFLTLLILQKGYGLVVIRLILLSHI